MSGPKPEFDVLDAAFPTLTTPAARNLNPGNLRDPSTGDWQKFDTVEEGFNALMNDIEAKKAGRTRTGLSGDSTLLDFFKSYAPEFENNTVHYASTVAKRLGVDLNTPIKSVETFELADAISRFEDQEFYKHQVAPQIQPLKTGEAPAPQFDESLLDQAFGSETHNTAQGLVERMREGERTRADVTPEQQAAFIEELQKKGKPRDTAEASLLTAALPMAADATAAQPSAPVQGEMSDMEKEVGIRRLAGEGRADFLTRTAPTRKLLTDLDAIQNDRPTIGAAPEGWEGIKSKLSNLRLFSSGKLVTTSQTPGGIDIGQMFRLGNQILSPTVGEVMEGNVGEAWDNFLEIGKGFAKALVDPFIVQPAKVLYDVASDENYLLPEERSDYIRSSIANYAGLLIGYGAGRVYSGTRTAVLTAGRTTLAEAATPELLALSRTAVSSNFRERIIKGSVEGLAGGGTTGFIEGKTIEEKKDLAVSYMLMGLPIGLAFEAVGARFTKGPATIDQRVAKEAGELFKLRQLRITENTTPDRAAANLYSMATEKDLAKALIRTGNESGDPVVVPDIATNEDMFLGYALTNVDEKGAVFRRPDGKVDYLHMPAADAHTKTMFSISGFLPDQSVSFLGQDYQYKGPVIEKGELKGHQILDEHGVEFEVPWNMVQRNADVLISPLEFDRFRAKNALYKDFKRSVNVLFDPDGKLKPDEIPDVPFTQMIDKYIQSKNLSANEIMPLRNFLEERMGQDLMNQSLPADERAAYQRIMRENANYKAKNPSDVVDLASSTGFYVDREGGSSMVLRDAESGNVMGRFQSNEEVKQFILASGRAEGPDLSGVGGAPPGSVGKPVMAAPPPPNGPHTVPYQFTKDGPLRQFSHWFNTTLLGTKVTGMRQIMISLDAQLGTEFAGQVWDPLYNVFKQKHAAAHADIKKAAGIAEFARGLNADELDHVTSLLETMAPDEMIKPGGLFKSRAFTEREIDGANWFINNRIDIAKAFQYRRALINLERKTRHLPETEKAAPVHALQAAMGVDEAHVEASRVIGEVLRINTPGELSIYGITRLANAVMNGELSPGKYIDTHKLSPKAVKLAEMIRNQFDELAPKFDIPDESRLGGYFAHYRNFKDDIPIVNQDNIPVFVSDLLRTGEMTEYDRDPINVLVRYINAGYNRKFTKAAWDNAANYIDRVTSRLGDDGPYIARLLKDNYLNELRGIPHDSSRLAQGFLDGMLDRLGVKTTVNARRDFVNTALSLSSSAAIGFRPMQGIRDVQNFVSIFYSRFGAKRTGDMMSIVARYTPEELKNLGVISDVLPDEGVQSALQREGMIPTISPISVLTAEERLENSLSGKTSRFREIVQKTGELGIKWGGQHNVYQWAHSAAYLESYVRGLDVLNRLVKGEFGQGPSAKTKAYKELLINTYDIPVGKEFDRLVGEGKFEDAAKFLGRASSFETVSVFGLANHPAGWGTNTGRLLGQFGSWPVWARSQLMRLATRGSAKERSAAMARFAMTQGATKAASWALGLNLAGWYLAPGALGYRGGPATSTIGSAMDVVGGSDRERDRALDQLSRQWMLGIPGSFLARDIWEGAEMAGAGINPISALARTLGVRSNGDPSMLNPYGVSQP